MPLNTAKSSKKLSPLPDPVHAVLFDLDGTLVDTVGDFDIALNHMLHTLGLPTIHAEEIRRIIGKGSEHLIRTVLAMQLKAANQPHDAVAVQAHFASAWDLYLQKYIHINGQHAVVYDGVLEGLEHLRKAGLPLGVVTNKPLALAVPLLEAKGLDYYMAFLFGGDSFAVKKPDPLPLLRACERLKTQPQNTVMIGDSSNDAKAARAAGCPVLLLPYGYNHGESIEEVDADGCIASIDAAAEYLLPKLPN